MTQTPPETPEAPSSPPSAPSGGESTPPSAPSGGETTPPSAPSGGESTPPSAAPGDADEIVPLTPPDPADSELPEPEPEPEPFADGPPPLPTPMVVLDGTLPPLPEPEPEVDHGTCRCGGKFDADGWCTECGERRPDPRHHFSVSASSRVAGVCDRGIRHEDNEDAMAVWAAEGEALQAALVVCDGVTTATRSAEASLAAAYAAVEVLTPDDPATSSDAATSSDSATSADPAERLARAADAAAEAVEEVGREFPDSAPSCTLVMAVVEDGLATVGNVGDSRAYWIPDEGEPARLTRDDSMAEEQVDAGMDRAAAEAGPLAHTITRWLGSDSHDHSPTITTQDVTAPGWLLLCSDGLWNYASAPADLRAVVRTEQQRVGTDPLALAQALVDWATARGGADNITVTLARTGDTTYPQAVVADEAGQDGHHG